MSPSLTVSSHSQQHPFSVTGSVSDSIYWPVSEDDGQQPDLTITVTRPLEPSEARALRSRLPEGVKVFLSTRALRGLRTPVRLGFVCLDSAADAFVSAVEGGGK